MKVSVPDAGFTKKHVCHCDCSNCVIGSFVSTWLVELIKPQYNIMAYRASAWRSKIELRNLFKSRHSIIVKHKRKSGRWYMHMVGSKPHGKLWPHSSLYVCSIYEDVHVYVCVCVCVWGGGGGGGGSTGGLVVGTPVYNTSGCEI